MSRRISGLRHAELTTNPWGKVPRARGARAQGLRFERSLGKTLPGAVQGQWLRFIDNAGPGHCCPDWLFVARGTLYVVECKLTDWDQAQEQLYGLYVPVLRLLWSGPVQGITAAKHLSPATRRDAIVTTWDDAMQRDNSVLHVFRTLVPPKVPISPPRLLAAASVLQRYHTEGAIPVGPQVSPLQQEGSLV